MNCRTPIIKHLECIGTIMNSKLLERNLILYPTTKHNTKQVNMKETSVNLFSILNASGKDIKLIAMLKMTIKMANRKLMSTCELNLVRTFMRIAEMEIAIIVTTPRYSILHENFETAIILILNSN